MISRRISIARAACVFVVVACALFPGDAAYGPISTNVFQAVLDVRGTIRGTNCSDEALVSAGSNTVGVLFDGIAKGLPERVGVDAAFWSGATLVFSTDVAFEKDGTVYEDEDLVRFSFNSGTNSMFFDGSVKGLPANADLNAACVAYGGGEFLFSLDITATLPGGLTVSDEDVIRYSTGTYTKAYDGVDDLGIPEAADLDALYQKSDGTLYYSLDRMATIPGIGTGDDEDVWVYVPGSGVTNLLRLNDIEARADLEALDYPLDSDGDWLTDFEELSGEDDPATTFPGTAVALNPSGHVSDPGNSDSDGDGMNDGPEAACGTDPGDGMDVLGFKEVRRELATNLLIWASVTGKNYALDYTDSLMNGFTNQLAGPILAADSTNRTAYEHQWSSSNIFYRLRLVP